MEALIDAGFIAGSLDVTTTEFCDLVAGGALVAVPERLESAGKRGIPQVVSLGALDMVNFGPLESVPERFRHRNLYSHNATVTLMRTTADECGEIGKRIAGQLNSATGPVSLMLPLRGVSMLDAPGFPFHDALADAALFQSLSRNVGAHVKVRELDMHINDDAFATALAEELLALLPSPAAR
jgi:uncharacterized protein (UPF0261 family)